MNNLELKELGLHELDEKYISKLPPRIRWGDDFQAWPDDKKMVYLDKLARAMNEAARLIQDERDQLNTLCIQKEAQLEQQNTQMQQNTSMLQSEILRMNEERQLYNTEIARLNKVMRDAGI